MKTTWLSLLLVLVAQAGIAAPLQLSITVDDLPWVEYGLSSREDVELRNRRLLQALHGTGAIGFVNEDKLYEGEVMLDWRLAMLRAWLNAGLDLGNHTYGHVGLHGATLEQFEAAIVNGETLLRHLLKQSDRELVWFRHPYLQTGRDDATRVTLDKFLSAHHYRVAPVTIDNSDWIFARAYIKALNAKDATTADRIRSQFVDYLLAKTAYFEAQARALLGRDIPQILLLHASALNADAMPEVLRRLRERGYAFVPLQIALEDTAYTRKDGYYGRGGISWLHRWAMAENKPTSFYAGEPTPTPEIMTMAGVSSE